MSLEVTASIADRHLDIGLEVATGEVVALLGPNGAGKSSILSVVAGLLRPDAGSTVLNGRVLTSGSTWVPPHARGVALLAQDPLLFPHLSVLDNVAFGPRSSGRSRAESRATARRWLDEVGATELADRKPHQLSGGQGQRVAIARALAAEPELLLLDEPMAALDVAITPALRQVLKRVLHSQTAIIVTHDLLDALLLADRVVVVEDGSIAESGACADVLARPRSGFAARIAGLNLVRGRWDGQAVRSDDISVTGMPAESDLAPGDAAVAVFRPSAVAVFRAAPGGSPRNTVEVAVSAIEPHGDQIRVRAGSLAADITAAAAADLDLAPGSSVVFSVKATEVAVYPA
ncbi:ABC transporter ATP-binding protein [Nocardioides sp. CN2-186]|uniref:sulfate/molybdate ABC transporter ATP-binding protein n=1 Tax=Nocardioides tweenelious TaxID=3156607 RepID=UPI0032B58CFE